MTKEEYECYRRCKDKCKKCEHRIVYTHSVVPYNFCTKLHASFSGSESEKFLNCGK